MKAGDTLGPYRILDKLGEGGMGEVYRATDTNLKRQVAIKVLPESVAGDPERLARFQREAEVLASLNHPHIAQIHGLERSDGRTGLVMELVEGPTLADRIAQGPIPVDEALPIARQIAEALEAAHEQGIIHRDLKPENIKLRPDATVKVLDFGLAKAMEPAGAMSPSVSMSPTITTPAMTQAGLILGTAAYMAPEQARGKPVDKRADIWAFGAVLYEMLTGERAFGGSEVSDVLASVLAREPDLNALPASVPMRIRQVLRLCFEKDPKRRARDIGDIALALDGRFEGVAPPLAEKRARGLARLVPIALALALGGLAVGAAAWRMWPAAELRNITRTTLSQPDAPLQVSNSSPAVAISPDGARIAYRASRGGLNALVVRPLDSLEGSVVLVGVNTAYAPFFSPDGQWVGFNDARDDTIKRVAVTGGAPLTVGAVGSGQMAGAVWTEDDRIIFGTAESSGLWQVDASGGTPEPFTRLDAARGETNHGWPDVLPDGRAVLFTVRRGGSPAAAEIVALDLATGERRGLVTGGSYARYVAPGYLVYGFLGELRAVRFDADRLAVDGTPVAVVDRLLTKTSGAAEFGVARMDGTLLYVRADPAATADDTLVWVDGMGLEESIETFGGSVQTPRMSPDRTRIVIVRTVDEGDEDLWLYSPSRAIAERFTDDAGLERDPAWSPDSSRIAYYATALDGGEGLFWRAADGTGPVQRLSTGNHRPISWLADDRIVYADLGTSVRGIGIVSVSRPGEGQLLLEVNMGTFSVRPDGSWIAYSDTVTGSYEVYVRPFPDVTGAATRISTGGGLDPVWSLDGTALYYRQDDSIMRVAIGTGPPASWDAPTTVFSGAYRFSIPGPTQFDIDRNGNRFLMIKRAGATGTSEPELVLVRNWAEELKALVPID